MIEQKTGQTSTFESVIKALESTGTNLPEELKAFAGLDGDAQPEHLNPVNDDSFAEHQLPNVIPQALSNEDYCKQLLSLLNGAFLIAKQSFADSWSDKWSIGADSYWGTTFGILKVINNCQRKIGDLSEAIVLW